ncbi:MAG: hypothetical protein ABW069_12755 [Duganella sp.]
MRLPGTRYQEHGWEHVRKLLGACSLQALRQIDMDGMPDPAQHAPLLDSYTDAMAAALRACARTARSEAEGNSYGDSVGELAQSLVFELQAHATHWQAFAATVAAEHARSGAFWRDAAADAVLRKKVNDMYAGLRDRVDADNYIAATGRDCSPNRIYTYRMLDTAYRDIARLFDAWQEHRAQVGAILGRDLAGIPIEARQMKSIADCRAEWIVAWSASQERFAGAPGPLHTKSKRFASLKNNRDGIAAMLREIGDYEELSSNQDSGAAWQGDAGQAAGWLEDYWRVTGDSARHEALGGVFDADCIVAPPGPGAPDADDGARDDNRDDKCDQADHEGDEVDDDGVDPAVTGEVDAQLAAAEQQAAAALSLPLRYMELARGAQAGGSRLLRILRHESLPIRLAVYHKLLGAADDSYPADWRDPATGELPTLQQLAALDGISMPTLRKRRNEAIDKLHAASAARHEGE